MADRVRPARRRLRLFRGRARAVALRGRLTPRSVRARATLAASSVVAVALVVASLAMLGLLQLNLRGNAEESARVKAVAVAKLAADGRLTTLVPIGPDTDFVQVVNADGKIVAVSQNVVGRPGLALVPIPGVKPGTGLGLLGGKAHEQVSSVVADTPKGQVVVSAGVSLGTADDAESTTALILAVGCPLLLLTVALVTWRVTGRALRPVEAIRSEVAAIGEQELHRRVPIPRGDDEITRLATTMNGMLDRLDLAGGRQRQFIADASHELRSPIAVLRTQLEVALGHPDADVREELVEGALQDAERLQALAADLLFLARLDAGSVDRPTDPTDLAELVRATVRRRSATPRDIVLDEVAEEVIVPGNRLWLTRLVTNLVDNAERYARSTVRIRVRGDEASAEGVLEVFNDGPAVEPADRERIFERFTRLDDARSREDGGTGLGLPIARDIAHHHGGTLAVVDSAQGATFQVRLPLAAAETGVVPAAGLLPAGPIRAPRDLPRRQDVPGEG